MYFSCATSQFIAFLLRDVLCGASQLQRQYIMILAMILLGL